MRNGGGDDEDMVKRVGLTVFSVNSKEVKEAIRRLQEPLEEEAEDTTLRFKDIDITLPLKDV
ncbi:MAG: hypothetical protein HZB68_05695 [Candidatus Aenigmarchaeota archaeon]|nr:hypothetical protein [Candidatus Aenigmarchaeota archaeon]